MPWLVTCEAHRLYPRGVWDYRRGNKLSRCVWDTNETTVDERPEAWIFLVNDLERIDMIARRPWACVNV